MFSNSIFGNFGNDLYRSFRELWNCFTFKQGQRSRGNDGKRLEAASFAGAAWGGGARDAARAFLA